MEGRGVEQYRRRMERAAQLRAAGAGGGLDPEDVEQAAAEEELQHKRRQVDDAARADYLVRDAMARGDFDNLKYAGKPIPGLGDGHDPDWWIKGLLQRENVTGLGPAAILLRTEDAELDARLDTRWSERQVREILEDFNARVINARRQLEGGPPVVTRTRDVEQEMLRWRERKAAAGAAEEAQRETAAPEAERRRWFRRKRRR
ncbi:MULTISPECIES: J-domain-containing protein [unclassified Arthrobacter]|uniref:DnaJ family domain-containing protein n=1 Tax=unclassified Arthrobacter TaxID=235627 RepID=UPI001D134D0A|nr:MULTISPECIES: DUF1992 domain-containing protein [unclassified Arthrobacter]MCC3275514.1 DUF1992 domain-containing protein [Arthrobacter sp. zg-Y20]MCC9176955.1 DUF1992 domain-containing protein [Arthrobacter sp. zg-Y750]MDK1315671.1 DUF1992 domain-containing protein [Arthrobacter sp. zg.Y20]WIB06081.1 DUF1992 domain-containing protein [Arthrobacter sp. zg-Y20]